MSTLHTVNKSPFQDQTLNSCLQVCGDEDCILLIEDGIYGAIEVSPCAAQLQNLIGQGIRIYVLEQDAKARGLQSFLPGIETTDYAGFVQLSCTHQCIQSWY